ARRVRDAQANGHKLTAASCFMRATRYYQTGERFIHPRSDRSMAVYATSVELFKAAAAIMRRPRIESVEVPYEGTSLPALLVHPEPDAAGPRPAPCMVFFEGFGGHQGLALRFRSARSRRAWRGMFARRRSRQRGERALS